MANICGKCSENIIIDAVTVCEPCTVSETYIKYVSANEVAVFKLFCCFKSLLKLFNNC